MYSCEQNLDSLNTYSADTIALSNPIKNCQATYLSISEVYIPCSFKKLEKVLKRIFDILIAGFGLVLLAPLFGVVAYIIWLETRGNVIYRQIRVGKDRRNRKSESEDYKSPERRAKAGQGQGQPFNLYKFRTMRHDAENDTGPVWANKNDPRVTRVGKWLRKTRLDELPQLWNVLKGEMSLIGPRPERPFFVELYRKKVLGYEGRFLVKPGITGIAQIYNGYDDSLDSVRRKVKYDITYVSNFSIWTDIKILIQTLPVVLRGEGAH